LFPTLSRQVFLFTIILFLGKKKRKRRAKVLSQIFFLLGKNNLKLHSFNLCFISLTNRKKIRASIKAMKRKLMLDRHRDSHLSLGFPYLSILAERIEIMPNFLKTSFFCDKADLSNVLACENAC
jgi:hypothetical protein